MSNLYSKIAQMKRNSEPANMSFSQTHWINGEKCNERFKIFSWCFWCLRKFSLVFLLKYFVSVSLVNNEVLMSPPHNNALLNQRDSMLITQPSSVPSSPLASPGAQSTSRSFCLQSALSNTNLNENDDPTTDPNWQATKPTVRERNAAMFNNELMADIKFVVGGDGELKENKFESNVRKVRCAQYFCLLFKDNWAKI